MSNLEFLPNEIERLNQILVQRSRELVDLHNNIQAVTNDLVEALKVKQKCKPSYEKIVDESKAEGFWLKTFLQNEILANEITMADQKVLRFLRGIRKSEADGTTTVDFIFDQANPFFTNDVLTLKIEMKGLKVRRIVGDHIKWYEPPCDVEEDEEFNMAEEFDSEKYYLVVDPRSMKLKKFPKTRKHKNVEKSFFDIFATNWLHQWDRVVDGQISRSDTRKKNQKRDTDYLEQLELHQSRVARVIFTLDRSILPNAMPCDSDAEELNLSKLTLEEKQVDYGDLEENKLQIEFMEKTLEFRTKMTQIVNEDPKFDDFWLNAMMMADKLLVHEITKEDTSILSHLRDISCHPTKSNDMFLVQFEFSFGPNEHFTNQSLFKVYHVKGETVTRSVGTRIDWKKENPKYKGFFNIFDTKVEEEEEDTDDILNYYEHEYDLMLTLCSLIPNVVLLYYKKLVRNREEKVEAYENLDTGLTDAYGVYNEVSGKLDPKEVTEISEILDAIDSWLEEHPDATKDEYDLMSEQVFDILWYMQQTAAGEETELCR